MKYFIVSTLLLTSSASYSQDIKNTQTATQEIRSNEIADLPNDENTRPAYPDIQWIMPSEETIFQKEVKVKLHFKVISDTDIKEISIRAVARNNKTQAQTTSKKITLTERLNDMVVTQDIELKQGINEVEVIAKNKSGSINYSYRYFHIGNPMKEAIKP